MIKEQKRGMKEKFELFLARYPITFYFGLLILFFTGLITWLHYRFDWSFNFAQFNLWLTRNSEPILIAVSLLLALTMIGSAMAYRQTCKLNHEEYLLWLNQRATRTLFPMFIPLHDYLRLRFKSYRWWHVQVYSSTIHTVLLFLFIAMSMFSVRSLYAPFPGEPSCSITLGISDVVITTNTTWSTNQCVGNVTIRNGATLTINGGISVSATGLNVGDTTSSGHIIAKGDLLNNMGVYMNITGSVVIHPGSTINANGQGYAGGTSGSMNGGGTGGGSSVANGADRSGGGGGYGGAGASFSSATGGNSYGTNTAPDHLGSGGAFASDSQADGNDLNGGAGGGALKLSSSGTMTINGTISANGDSSLGAGGGSGGTIWLIANSFAGSGSVTAKGGNGGTSNAVGGGGGGGGRILRQFTSSNGPNLTLRATKGTGGTGGADGSITNVGTATSFSVTGLAATTAGSSQSFTLTARDSTNAVASTFTGTVSFSSTDDQATLPGNYSFTAANNGVATISGLILKTAGTHSVNATQIGNTSVTGSQTGVAVYPGNTVSFLLTKKGDSTATAGEELDFSVIAKDVYNNTVTGFKGKVMFTSTDAQANLPGEYGFVEGDSGMKIVTVILKTAGSQSVTVSTSSNQSRSNGISKGTLNVTVNPGNLAGYLFSTSAAQTVSIGWSQTVTAKDAYNNTLSGHAATLTPTSTGSAKFYTDDRYNVITSTYQLSSGQTTIYVKDAVAEKIKIRVTNEQNIAGESTEITVGGSTTGGNTSAGGTGTTAPNTNTQSDPISCPAGQKLVTSTTIGDDEATRSICVDDPVVSMPTTPLEKLDQGAAAALENAYSQNEIVANVANTAIAITTPVLTAAAVGPIGTAMTSAIINGMVKGVSVFNTQFLGLVPTRRRRRWGIVRSNQTGLPLGGVFIELLDQSGKVINKTMTDKTGRYGFLVDQPGSYQIQINNPLYQRYWSQPIVVTDPARDIIDESITLVPVDQELTKRLSKISQVLKVAKALNYLHWPLMIFGSGLAIYVYYQDPNLIKALILALYSFLWLSKLLEIEYRRPYGIVVDAVTGAPQDFSVVQISSDPDVSHKTAVVRSTITDSQGRFLFIVKPEIYHLVAAKEGYRPAEMLINGETVNLTVKLHPDKTAR